MKTEPVPFPVAIRKLREQKGLSLSQAASLAGCTKPHIHEMERGRSINPTAKMLSGLARAYGVSPATLLRLAIGSQEEKA